jgi:DHA2 family multidrug resistance protein
VALATMLLVRRSQQHQTRLVGHVDIWSAETTEQLQEWTRHFMSQGADSFTAGRQALAMVYRRTVEQAQVLAYADDFWLIAMVFLAILPLLPFMRRVRTEQNERARETSGRVEPLPVPEE